MKTLTALLALTLSLVGTASGQCPTTPLMTTFTSNNGQSGNMFDIVAIQDVTICSFDIHCDAINPTETVEIYTKAGTHVGFQTTPTAWTLIGAASVPCAGLGLPTPVPIAVNTPIPAGATQAFYVTLTTSTNINYTNGVAVSGVFTQDANIQILEGSGIAYPYGGTFMPRVWNGIVNYCTGLTALCPAPPPPPYQVNQINSALDLNGVQSNGLNPAITPTTVGTTTVLTSNTALPATFFDLWFDIGPATMLFPGPGLPAAVTPNGQVVNVDLSSLSGQFLNGGSFAPHPGIPLQFALTCPTPLQATAQQAVLDATHPDSISLSQAVQLNCL